MIVQCDSREHKGKNAHILDYFDEVGIKHFTSKLVVGDYMNLDNPKLVVDRKKDLQEVAGNLTKDHERFRTECERAKDLGIHLIILVEEKTINRIDKVPSWYNYRRAKNPKAISGKQLWKIMTTMAEKYDIEWKFSTRENYGRKLVELLEVQK